MPLTSKIQKTSSLINYLIRFYKFTFLDFCLHPLCSPLHTTIILQSLFVQREQKCNCLSSNKDAEKPFRPRSKCVISNSLETFQAISLRWWQFCVPFQMERPATSGQDALGLLELNLRCCNAGKDVCAQTHCCRFVLFRHSNADAFYFLWFPQKKGKYPIGLYLWSIVFTALSYIRFW